MKDNPLTKGKLYRGIVLMPGSKALELFEKNEIKELDKHLKEVDSTFKQYLERYK